MTRLEDEFAVAYACEVDWWSLTMEGRGNGREGSGDTLTAPARAQFDLTTFFIPSQTMSGKILSVETH